nr:MAG TPA: hypothetical protein [Caudoviricetes sp.]DAJ80374.1 MAG TPA: hypothetical protein [Caudoviricetes sp.]
MKAGEIRKKYINGIENFIKKHSELINIVIELINLAIQIFKN